MLRLFCYFYVLIFIGDNYGKYSSSLITKNNKLLIAKRLTGDLNVLGKWEFFDGKVKGNETLEEAIEREILEEFELNDHSEYRWIDKKDLLDYDLAQADIELAKYVMGE